MAAHRGAAPLRRVLLFLLLCQAAPQAWCRRTEPHYGRPIGRLTEYAHGIRGTAYAVDESTVFIRGFAYDGTGPDAFFWAGDSQRPSPEGFLIPYPEDYIGRDPPILSRYVNADVLLRLPGGKRLRDIKWISVWCRRFTVNFGEVLIPPGLEPPRARVLPEFRRLAHGLRSGNISVLDAKTFYIPNLHYDGAGPDAFFWVGNGSEPNEYGTKVPNELGQLEKLHPYQGEDIEIQLPDRMTVYDIDWLAVWCITYRHNFGHVFIPRDLDVPPALGQTKITPPWWYNPTTPTTIQTPAVLLKNCKEMLDRRLQVRWEKQDDFVVISLTARIREDQYMAFGLSGGEGKPAMIGADATVAWWDVRSGTPKAQDYYMSHFSQCDGQKGVCPDERVGGGNDLLLLSGNRTDGMTTVVFRRPLRARDSMLDSEIITTRSMSVIAAFGPLNSRREANAHSISDKTTSDVQLDFGAQDDNTCVGLADPETSGPKPWPPRIIYNTSEFTARIGPAGGKRGYTPTTGNDINHGSKYMSIGNPSWGIAWWINDKLIPELYVEKGKTYTFLVEGGNDNTRPAQYHPFYITDSPEGGFEQKNDMERKKQRIFAGVSYDAQGYPYPTAAGRYCEWKHRTIDLADTKETFEDYTKTLELTCGPGEPAVLNWTVAEGTPPEVYYQCYTHNHLGWKIHVVEQGSKLPGDLTAAGHAIELSLAASFVAVLRYVVLA